MLRAGRSRCPLSQPSVAPALGSARLHAQAGRGEKQTQQVNPGTTWAPSCPQDQTEVSLKPRVGCVGMRGTVSSWSLESVSVSSAFCQRLLAQPLECSPLCSSRRPWGRSPPPSQLPPAASHHQLLELPFLFSQNLSLSFLSHQVA